MVVAPLAAVWNQNGTASLNTFTIEGSLTSDFSVSTSLSGILTMSQFGGGNPIAADVFALTKASVQYIRLNVISNAGLSSATRINEIAFRQAGDVAAVPEPGSIGLLGLGLLGLAFVRRRTT